jgi:hypothetical protein
VGTHWHHRGNDVRIEPSGTDQRKRWPGGTVVPRGERAWSPIRIRTMPPSLTSSTAKRKRMPASARSPLCQPRPRSRRAHRRSHRDRGGQYRDQHAAGRHDVSVSARAEFGACAAALNAIQVRRPSQGSNLPWADLRNDIARYVELRCQKGAMSALAPRLRISGLISDIAKSTLLTP